MAKLLAARAGGTTLPPVTNEDGIIEYSLTDFHGTYHQSRIASEDTIPGINVARDRQLKEATKERQDRLAGRIQSIRNNFKAKTKKRDRRAAVEVKALIDGGVGDAAGRIQLYLNDKEDELLAKAEMEEKRSIGGAFHRKVQTRDFFAFVHNNKPNHIDRLVKRGFRGVDIQQPDYGHTGLFTTAKKGFIETMEVLLRHGADPEIPSDFGEYPIHKCWDWWDDAARDEAAEAQGKRTVRLLRLLLQYGADPDAQDGQGNTALHFAALRGPNNAVKVLLEFRATHKIKNALHKYPMSIATANENWEVVRLLHHWSLIFASYRSEEFRLAWMHFCKDVDSSLISSKPSRLLANELRIKEEQKRLERTTREAFRTLDDVVTGGKQMANDNVATPATLFSTKSMANLFNRSAADDSRKRDRKAHRKKQEAQGPATRLPTKDPLPVPIDAYLRGTIATPFVETKDPRRELEAKKKKQEEEEKSSMRGTGHAMVDAKVKLPAKDTLWEERPMTKNDARRLLSAVEVARDGSVEFKVKRSARASSAFTARRVKVPRLKSKTRGNPLGEYVGGLLDNRRPPQPTEGPGYKKRLWKPPALTAREMMQLASPMSRGGPAGAVAGGWGFDPAGFSPGGQAPYEGRGATGGGGTRTASSLGSRMASGAGGRKSGKSAAPGMQSGASALAAERMLSNMSQRINFPRQLTDDRRGRFNEETNMPPGRRKDPVEESMSQALDEVMKKHVSKRKWEERRRKRDLALSRMHAATKRDADGAQLEASVHEDSVYSSVEEGVAVRFHPSAPFVKAKQDNLRPNKATYGGGAGKLEMPWRSTRPGYHVPFEI